MSDHDSVRDASSMESPGFSDLVVDLDVNEIQRRLDLAARRGRVPGLHVGSHPTLFYVDGCGTPFEHHLVATGSPAEGGIRIRFSLKRLKRVPLIFAVVLVLTIWPGVYFMDQLIPGEWNWIKTEYWYLPLAILPIPWFWRSTARKSEAIAVEDCSAIVQKIRSELESPA